MKTLLQITSSLSGPRGQSTHLAEQFVAGWRAAHPGAQVLRRDLHAEPVPHLDGERFQAFVTKAEARSAAQQAIVDYSDELIGELRRADVLVLGLPMYNFGVPSQLKAWFDHLARAGVTFRYTERGPQGLLTGKKAYVFATRGGQYAGTPLDTQTAYVRDFLRFIGIDDVEFVHAEGLNMGEATRDAALARAAGAIDALLPAPLAA